MQAGEAAAGAERQGPVPPHDGPLGASQRRRHGHCARGVTGLAFVAILSLLRSGVVVFAVKRAGRRVLWRCSCGCIAYLSACLCIAACVTSLPTVAAHIYLAKGRCASKRVSWRADAVHKRGGGVAHPRRRAAGGHLGEAPHHRHEADGQCALRLSAALLVYLSNVLLASLGRCRALPVCCHAGHT